MSLQELLGALIDHVSVNEGLRSELHAAAKNLVVIGVVDEKGSQKLKFIDARDYESTSEPEGA